MSQEEEVKKLKQEVKQLKKEVKHLKKDTWKIKNCLVDHRNEMDRMNIKIENAIRQKAEEPGTPNLPPGRVDASGQAQPNAPSTSSPSHGNQAATSPTLSRSLSGDEEVLAGAPISPMDLSSTNISLENNSYPGDSFPTPSSVHSSLRTPSPQGQPQEKNIEVITLE